MVVPSLQSLQNLCGIRIAYLMWIHHDLFKRRSEEELFEDFFSVISTDVTTLSLPDKLKSLILNHVEPTGKHLLSLLNLWFTNTQPENSQAWLTEEMLFECLALNAYGLINPLKTAENILGSRLLHNEFAFRLACSNFFEIEVLKLWPSVKNYFLHKVVLESEMCPASKLLYKQKSRENPYVSLVRCYYEARDLIPFTTESNEVLFWISYCLCKENAIKMNDIPHFKKDNWLRYSVKSAASCGNAACFDYFYGFRDADIKYCSSKLIREYFLISEVDALQSCFVSHFKLLSNEEKAGLFRQCPRAVLCRFLQWPLSLTFVEKTEEIWDFIPDHCKDWIFLKLFAIFFHKNATILPFKHEFYQYQLFDDSHSITIAGIHNMEHIKNIWVALWKISSDSHKSTLFSVFVFPSIWLTNVEFLADLQIPDIKEKLIHLFLTSGEAILELYKGANIRDSLKSLIAKYMTEGFDDGNRRYIPVKIDYSFRTYVTFPVEELNTSKNVENQLDKSFLNYLKNLVILSNSIDNSFFYK